MHWLLRACNLGLIVFMIVELLAGSSKNQVLSLSIDRMGYSGVNIRSDVKAPFQY